MKRPATRVADLLNPAAMLLPAANVIMQLSLPGVGYGVLESQVDSGLKDKGSTSIRSSGPAPPAPTWPSQPSAPSPTGL